MALFRSFSKPLAPADWSQIPLLSFLLCLMTSILSIMGFYISNDNYKDADERCCITWYGRSRLHPPLFCFCFVCLFLAFCDFCLLINSVISFSVYNVKCILRLFDETLVVALVYVITENLINKNGLVNQYSVSLLNFKSFLQNQHLVSV